MAQPQRIPTTMMPFAFMCKQPAMPSIEEVSEIRFTLRALIRQTPAKARLRGRLNNNPSLSQCGNPVHRNKLRPVSPMFDKVNVFYAAPHFLCGVVEHDDLQF
jgi:hypothetical protein